MTNLVEKLSNGQHAVSLIRYKNTADLKEAIDRGLVLVKFTETQGGTELGVQLDKDAKGIDFDSGKIELTGSLTLDYQPVICTVNIDLETLSGQGSLKLAEPA
ncbi:hypothetical protein [Undibacterium sp. TJN19]|uniref:hypothetical protein n=1 Tax=Undibacterium sp. TJN19 TaxID=3413055 RepID=UPI003BF2419B